jgi:hypothetical protein
MASAIDAGKCRVGAMGRRSFALLRALTCKQALRRAASRADLRKRSGFSIAFQTIIDLMQGTGPS